jgi:hypothetical protein
LLVFTHGWAAPENRKAAQLRSHPPQLSLVRVLNNNLHNPLKVRSESERGTDLFSLCPSITFAPLGLKTPFFTLQNAPAEIAFICIVVGGKAIIPKAVCCGVGAEET